MRIVASEKTIAESPNPQGIYLYTPAIAEGFGGRFVAAIDFGGPDTAQLDGPRSDFGDYPSGNQIRILLSDDRGESWRDSNARIPMMHEILFKAGSALYMVGHSGRLLAVRSDDNGETWSEPAVLVAQPRWHQSCCAVDVHDGKVTLVYEKWLGDGHPWPGVGPVLMQADEHADLTKAENWKFSQLFDPDDVIRRARPSGIPALPVDFTPGLPAPGILETNVVRLHDETHPWFDKDDKSVILLMRANTGLQDIGACLKGIEKKDGTLAVEQLSDSFGGKLFFMHIPGGNLKFHICYDGKSRLYWMVHSQISGRMNERRRLAVSFSPDLLQWTFAGIVAIGPSDNGARHYATMMISGDDMFVISRSGDERARNAHDNNLTTFHKIPNFRELVY